MARSEDPGVYYIPGRWVDRRQPLTLRRLGAPRGAPGVEHLYALFFEAHPDVTMRTRVCETCGAGYAEVEYICTHPGTLFEGVPGCTQMPPVHFPVSPPKGETKVSVRRNGNRAIARYALLWHALWHIGSRGDTTFPWRTSPELARAWSSRP